MSNIFTEVELNRVASNSFNLEHDHKLSLRMGFLVPINLMECLPGDKINGSTTTMMRMMPMIAPIMHKVNVDIHHFFVPNRIVWPNWEKFIVAGVPNEDTPAHPYFADVPVAVSDLADYMGLPLTAGLPGNGIAKVNALPFAAYNKVYNDYFRDENLIQPLDDTLVDGQNPFFDVSVPKYSLRRRAWQHDYFTSALPFAQKGEAVTIPLGDTAPLLYDRTKGATVVDQTGGAPITGNAQLFAQGSPTPLRNLVNSSNQGYNIDVHGNTVADLSEASAITINSLRWAVRLQEFLERNARGGTRYIENILAHFNVKSSDKRLQRPEFLGGSSNPMVISEVMQNAPATTEQDTPQGNMAGHGLMVGKGRHIDYFVEEHGFFITLMSVRPTTAYQQGLPRHFTKFDPLDYAWPSFANVGEQAIRNEEIFWNPNNELVNKGTFGYIPRYAEYKYAPSRVSGQFRTSLAFWHMGRIFQTRPALNESFISADPTTRIFAVEDPNSDNLLAHVMHDIRVRRRLPRFGIPTL